MKVIELTKGLVTYVDDDDYDWLLQWNWTANSENYVVRTDSNNRAVLMHREIMSRFLGRPLSKNEWVDHEKRNPLDNRKSGLRITDPSHNCANRPKSSNNTSGFKGVHFHPNGNRWRAQITVNRKQKHIGLYSTPEEAAKAYDKSAVENFGEFAYLNFPNE